MSEGYTQEITYRKHMEGDDQSILDLFNLVFNKNITPTRWNWANKDNPNGPTYHNLAICDSKLIGQSAAVPLLFNHEGNILKAARVQNVMVHSDFRKRGIFLSTLEGLTTHLHDEELDFIITFPNDKSIPAFIRKLDYHHIFDIFIYSLPVESLGGGNNVNLKYEFEEEVHVTQKDIEFVYSRLSDFDIFNARNLEYVNWRYHQNSTNKYVLVRTFKGDQQVGLVVYKPYMEGMSIDLVEFFIETDKNTIRSTLNTIYEICRNNMVRSFNIWSMDHYPFHQSLVDLGFKKTVHATHVVYKSLSSKTSKDCDKMDSYYLSMGDSDVY